jgi:hypothetical protein
MAFLVSRSALFRSLGVAVALSLVAAAPGCSRQAEGDRCDSQNGNADCEDGLVCRTAGSLNAPSDVCCPATGEATTTACRGQSQAGLDAGIPDTGATTTDAGTDTGSQDAGAVDSGQDAAPAADSGAISDAATNG